MTTTETPNERAVRMLRELEAERKSKSDASKQRMGLKDTLRITGKTRPEHVGMGKRLVIWERED